jgi:hypothetical protein
MCPFPKKKKRERRKERKREKRKKKSESKDSVPLTIFKAVFKVFKDSISKVSTARSPAMFKGSISEL